MNQTFNLMKPADLVGIHLDDYWKEISVSIRSMLKEKFVEIYTINMKEDKNFNDYENSIKEQLAWMVEEDNPRETHLHIDHCGDFIVVMYAFNNYTIYKCKKGEKVLKFMSVTNADSFMQHLNNL